MANSDFLISVIVTTYNRPKALDRVLDGLMHQTDNNFEIVIADDGSGEETQKVVREWQTKSKVRITHAWQEDLGFRLNASRNNGIRNSRGNYVVILDGDCVPRSNFVEQHRKLSEQGCAVAGHRCLLDSNLTTLIENHKVSLNNWTWCDFFKARLSGQINRLDALITLPPKISFRYKTASNWKRLRGCNMGMFRSDIERVNGFNEDFSGWGFDDSDIAVRLINAGVKVKNGAFATAVFHLYHQETELKQEGDNWNIFCKTLSEGHVQARHGLKSLP